MTYCTKCGAVLPEDARFCPSCGTPVAQAEEEPTREHHALKVVEKPKVVILQRAPGRIDVKKGTESEVNVDLDLRERRDLDWSVTQEGNVVTIKARALVHPLRWPRYFVSGGPRADIAVSVPAEADLDISTSIGEVAVAGIRGALSIESSVAKVTIEECEGNVRVVGKTGPIDLRNIKGITTVDSTTGPATLENVNGTVTVRNTTGPIRFSGSLSSGENWFRTSTGPIEITLQDQSDLKVEAYSRLGRVTSVPELADSRYERGQYTGRLGNGTGKLTVETKTGPITIRH
ncbi:MAG: DUF4097 family beta strand repeat-containing protein [Candidatus Bathyarchaeia archaeon]|jgi:lia operon protein LiaG